MMKQEAEAKAAAAAAAMALTPDHHGLPWQTRASPQCHLHLPLQMCSAMDPASFSQETYPSSTLAFSTGYAAGPPFLAWSTSEPEPLPASYVPIQPARWIAGSHGLLLPHAPAMIKPDPGLDDFPLDMASLAATGGSSSSGNKQIPLLCTVCPETPRFSDVSHLLTHIASKGHLHHETQTKLKAHQDISASVALQQYEQWYKENGIEGLLVERMKAKQLKEAARNKRSRGTPTIAPLKQAKKKVKRPPINTLIKTEHEEFPQDYPIFPGFFPSDNDAEIHDDFFGSSDMMALKGQVWPGMGKMDLANEDMKRTRNQRKPKSVIERMRRTSEGIEPTQVVMNPEFEVERIKDVYDSSSPIPGQEKATPPKKVTKPRRKRTEPLAEISANIPRGGNRRLARGNPAHDKISKPILGYSRTPSSELTPSLGQFKRSHDVFRDEDAIPGPYEDRTISGSSQREPRFDLRGRLGLHQLNPISHPNLVSPTPSSRDIPDRSFSARDLNRGRGQGQSYLGIHNHVSLGSLNHPELSYALNDAAIYSNSARMSFAPGNQFNTMSHEHFRLSSGHQTQPKLEEYSNSSGGDSIANSVTNQFLRIPGVNPLFSQDRLFLGSCNQPGSAQNLSSLGFTPINRLQDPTQSIRHDQDQRQPGANNVKLEHQLCDVLDNANVDDTKDSGFNVNGLWEPQGPENDMDIHEDLRSEELDL